MSQKTLILVAFQNYILHHRRLCWINLMIFKSNPLLIGFQCCSALEFSSIYEFSYSQHQCRLQYGFRIVRLTSTSNFYSALAQNKATRTKTQAIHHHRHLPMAIRRIPPRSTARTALCGAMSWKTPWLAISARVVSIIGGKKRNEFQIWSEFQRFFTLHSQQTHGNDAADTGTLQYGNRS